MGGRERNTPQKGEQRTKKSVALSDYTGWGSSSEKSRKLGTQRSEGPISGTLDRGKKRNGIYEDSTQFDPWQVRRGRRARHKDLRKKGHIIQGAAASPEMRDYNHVIKG